MPDNYNVAIADMPTPLTLGAVVYIVVDFTDSGHSANVYDAMKSDGSYEECAMTKGPRSATMKIQTRGNQVTPSQFDEFNYRGQSWIIQQVGRNSTTGMGTIDLTLKWKPPAPPA